MRRLRCFATAVLCAVPLTVPAQQPYPAKPVRLVVPFTPAGSTDILARATAFALTEAWKEQVIVENKPGAGGMIGAEFVARAAPDGYTLLMGHIGTMAVNPTLYPKLPYDAVRDFAPIALVAMVPNVFVVHPGLPARSIAELIALAKARPGTLTYSSGGVGSAAHLAVEYFKLVSGTDIVHVPYKGTGPAIADLISGQISLTMTGLPPSQQHVKAGKLRALGVAGKDRLPQWPDVPTLHESGLTDFETTQWYGVLAPARTPVAIVEKVAADIAAALARPDMRQRLETEGAQPRTMGPAEFGAFIRAEIDRWGKVIRAAGIRPE